MSLFVFIPYFIWAILSKKNFVNSRMFGKKIKRVDSHIEGVSIEVGG